MVKSCSVVNCDRDSRALTYCQAHYLRLKRTGSVMENVPIHKKGKSRRKRKPKFNITLEKIEQDLYSKVKKVQYPGVDGECWEYEDAYPNGYAAYSCTFEGKTYSGGHCASMLVKRGGKSWDKPLMVLHKCGKTRACVKKEHLKLGDYFENLDDAYKHGTMKSQLNDERVRKIRWMVKKYGHRKGFKARSKHTPVSYTHLTLPTIYSV